MPLHLPTFYKRTASAIVFAAIMLTGLLVNDWTFLALVCLISTLALYEYCKLMQQANKSAYWPSWLPALVMVAGLFIILPAFFINHLFDSPMPDWPMRVWLVLPVLPALLLMMAALPQHDYLSAMMQSITGLLYIPLSMLLLLNLHMQDMYLPVMLIAMIWANDTLAYIVGSLIGKTPLSQISPKKTVEGTVGGALLTIGGALAYAYFTHSQYVMQHWIALALCATVAGTLGDLLESKLKRLAGVKDSGKLMPGHGGALDRFDSLLVAAPFAYMYANYFMK